MGYGYTATFIFTNIYHNYALFIYQLMNTMDKDTTYWNTHKIVWDEMLSEIDNEIVTKIYNNPNCNEGKLFSRRVSKEVEVRLQLQTN